MEGKDFKVELTVNNNKVGLKPYVKSVFINVMLGLIKTLKGIDSPEEIVLKLSR